MALANQETICQIFRPQPGEMPKLRTIRIGQNPPTNSVLAELLPRFLAWEEEILGFYVAGLGEYGCITQWVGKAFRIRNWPYKAGSTPWEVVEKSRLAIEWLFKAGKLAGVRTYLWVPSEFMPPARPFILEFSAFATLEEMLDSFERMHRRTALPPGWEG